MQAIRGTAMVRYEPHSGSAAAARAVVAPVQPVASVAGFERAVTPPSARAASPAGPPEPVPTGYPRSVPRRGRLIDCYA